MLWSPAGMFSVYRVGRTSWIDVLRMLSLTIKANNDVYICLFSFFLAFLLKNFMSLLRGEGVGGKG